MDALLAIASKREVRSYASRPVPADAVERVLQAGRVAGSALNRQPWRFLVLESEGVRLSAAEAVFAPQNLSGAPLAVAIAVRGGRTADFDAGRAAQNMMLAAANDGLGSSPNGVSEPERMAKLLELAEDERVAAILSLGYPANPRNVESRSVEEWLGRAKRKPLEEIVRRL